MKKYRRKEIVEAVQWFKIGDHPDVVDIPEKYKNYVPVILGATGFLYSKNRDSGYFVNSGDWIVKFNEEDDLHRYTNDMFNKLFEEIYEETTSTICKFGKGTQDMKTCKMIYIHWPGYYPTDESYQYALENLCPNFKNEEFCDKSCKECEHESEDCVMLDNDNNN